MADKNPASKTLGEQATDTANYVRSAVASVVSGEPRAQANTATSPASTGPTVAGSLADAWESVKQATGLAGEKGAQTAAVGKAQAENTRVDANEKISQIAGNTSLQVENVKEHVARQADAAKLTASGMVHDARKEAAHKIEPKD